LGTTFVPEEETHVIVLCMTSTISFAKTRPKIAAEKPTMAQVIQTIALAKSLNFSLSIFSSRSMRRIHHSTAASEAAELCSVCCSWGLTSHQVGNCSLHLGLGFLDRLWG
jgi:hypothetical protein